MSTGDKVLVKPIIAQDATLAIREMAISDAPFIYTLTNQPAWLQFIGDRKVYSIKDAQAYIQKGPLVSYRLNNYGPYLVVCIRHEEDENGKRIDVQTPVGMCGLLKRKYLDSPDLGFAISEQYYQQGYAYKASKLVLNLAKKQGIADCIYATTTLDNIASQSLLLKLGFTKNPNPIFVDEEEIALFRKHI